MKRKIYNDLLAWKNDTKNIKPLMILGARQVGKTYIIDKFCQKEFTHYIHVNLLEDTNIIELYESNLSSLEKFKQLKLLLDFDLETEDTILFIDEIQESEKLISELKYFCEKHQSLRVIVAGSLLGVKLKRSKSSFPVGKVKMLMMYPMDFEEFLIAMDKGMLVNEIKKHFENNSMMPNPTHEKALSLYRLYLITGGMPESVNNMLEVEGDIIKYDNTILNNIINSYFNDMNKFVTNDSEALKIERIYHSIASQLSNESNKFQYSKVKTGAKARDYEVALSWLEASNLVLKSYYVSTPEVPLKGFVKPETFKLFMNDVGLLNRELGLRNVDIYTDNLSLYKGAIAENYVACELTNKGIPLYYWKSEGIAEIDFLIYNSDGIIPIEVKAGDATQSKSLYTYIDKFKPKYAIRISTKNFGYDSINKIKFIPLYAVFCLK